MTYSWTEAAKTQGVPDKIPAGVGIPVKITKVVFSKKGGTPFKSRAGDPQIGVVFQDIDGNQAMQMLTLSAKAGWVLARLLSRFGFNVKTLEDDGIELAHFAQPAIAEPRLVGLRGTVNITYDQDGYAQIEPCEQAQPGTAAASKPPASAPSAKPAVEMTDADIPF